MKMYGKLFNQLVTIGDKLKNRDSWKPKAKNNLKKNNKIVVYLLCIFLKAFIFIVLSLLLVLIY